MQHDHNLKHELLTVIRYCVMRGLSAADTYREMANAYGTERVKEGTVKKWHHRFLQGRPLREDDPKSGRPATATDPSHVAAARAILEGDPTITAEALGVELGISESSAAKIIHDKLHFEHDKAGYHASKGSPQ